MQWTAYPKVDQNDSYSHLSLAYIEYACMYDVIDDVIKAWMHEQNCPDFVLFSFAHLD